MRYVIKILLVYLIFAFSLNASLWKLNDMDFKYTDSIYSQYIYIPEGERFYKNELIGKIYGSQQHSYVEVYLDDKLVGVIALHQKDSFHIDLPVMKKGFHKITFLGLPDTLVLSIQNERDDKYCPKMRELPFGLEDVKMKFQSKIVALPKLKNYQEVFFNPSFPSKKILTCSLVFDEETPVVLSSIARMMSEIKVPMRGIKFIKGETKDTDFSLVFHKLSVHESKKAFIQIERKRKICFLKDSGAKTYEIMPARLTFNYLDGDNLLESVNSLLNKDYLKVIEATKAFIYTEVVEPEWGILKNYRTLKELGVNDTKLIGDGKTFLLLNYPIYWQPTDRLNGKIVIRSQAALPQDTHLNIWLDEVLAGSVSVSFLQRDDIQRVIPVDGLYVPKKHQVKMEFDTILNTRRICDDPAPGNLWISSKNSWIEMPHRQKTGILSLLPTLVAKPTISIFPVSSGTLSAVSTFVQEEQKVTFNKPLAYKMSTPLDDTTTLQVEINKKAMQKFFLKNSSKVNSAIISRSVWLHLYKDSQVKVVATNDDALESFHRVWKKVLNDIPDGAIDILVDTISKEIVLINKLKNLKEPRNFKLNNTEYIYGIIFIVVIFLSLLIWVLLPSYRKVFGK